MSDKGKYTRCVLLAGASSLAFLLSMLLISYSEDGAVNGIVSTIAMYSSFLIFGTLVLVPHVPIRTRSPARVLFLICLPLLLVWAVFGVVEGVSQGLDKIIDRYIPISAWIWAYAIAGGAWILALTYATLRTAQLRRSKRFWHYVSLVALVVGILIFGVGINFCLFFCSKWNEPVMIISGVLLLLVTPLAVTTALYFGTEC